MELLIFEVLRCREAKDQRFLNKFNKKATFEEEVIRQHLAQLDLEEEKIRQQFLHMD